MKSGDARETNFLDSVVGLVTLARFALAHLCNLPPRYSNTSPAANAREAPSLLARHYRTPVMLPSAAELVARYLRANGFTEV